MILQIKSNEIQNTKHVCFIITAALCVLINDDDDDDDDDDDKLQKYCNTKVQKCNQKTQ